MSHGKLTSIHRDEAGIVLVEIVVSAMLLIIVALGVFTAFDVGTRSSAEERHRARAHSLAEADVARMESMRIADLATLNQTRTVTQDGLDYTIDSKAEFVTEDASTSTCAAGTGSRDYQRVSATVTWATIGTRPPVVVSRIVSPPNGSVVPNSGSLLVSVDNAVGASVSGVTLTGSGAGSFTGTTGPTGCVLWRNLPAGNYTMSIAGAASGKVDPNGDPPSPRAVSVVAQSTNTVALEYDTPGRIANVTFRTEPYGNAALITSGTESIVVDHSSMDTVKVFTPPGGGRATSFTTTSTLFPFPAPSAYNVYAGTCNANYPGPGDALASLVVPAGGTATLPTNKPYIQLPALHLTVYGGSNTSSPRVANATVKVRDLGCGNFLREMTTNTNGQLADPGLPWSTYSVCVSGTATNNTTRQRTASNVELKSLNQGIPLDMTLQGSGSSSGSCA